MTTIDEAEVAVIQAAVAVMDQLNAFNDPRHPEVHTQLLRLQQAVGTYLTRPASLDHQLRHQALHRAFDELVADYINHQPVHGGKRLGNTSVLELLTWSGHQTEHPTDPRR